MNTTTFRAQWLDEAVRVTLGYAFCKSVWGASAPHNHLGILVTMPETVKCIRLEYNRIADRACEEMRPDLGFSESTMNYVRALEIF